MKGRTGGREGVLKKNLSNYFVTDESINPVGLNIALGFSLSASQVNAGFKKNANRGAWVAPSVKRPTSAQVMISGSGSSSPASGSVSPSLSAPPLFILCLSGSQK